MLLPGPLMVLARGAIATPPGTSSCGWRLYMNAVDYADIRKFGRDIVRPRASVYDLKRGYQSDLFEGTDVPLEVWTSKVVHQKTLFFVSPDAKLPEIDPDVWHLNEEFRARYVDLMRASLDVPLLTNCHSEMMMCSYGVVGATESERRSPGPSLWAILKEE